MGSLDVDWICLNCGEVWALRFVLQQQCDRCGWKMPKEKPRKTKEGD